jgi:hypothetical protein
VGEAPLIKGRYWRLADLKGLNMIPTEMVRTIRARDSRHEAAVRALQSATRQDIGTLLAIERNAYRDGLRNTTVRRVAIPAVLVLSWISAYYSVLWGLPQPAINYPTIALMMTAMSPYFAGPELIPSSQHIRAIMALSYVKDDRVVPALLRGMHISRNLFDRLSRAEDKHLDASLQERVLAFKSPSTFTLDYVTSRWVIYPLRGGFYGPLGGGTVDNPHSLPYLIALIGLPPVAEYRQTRSLLMRMARTRPRNERQAAMRDAAIAALERPN